MSLLIWTILIMDRLPQLLIDGKAFFMLEGLNAIVGPFPISLSFWVCWFNTSNLVDLNFPLFFLKSKSFISKGCPKLWTAICCQRLYIWIRRQFSVGSSDVAALLESARDCNWYSVI